MPVTNNNVQKVAMNNLIKIFPSSFVEPFQWIYDRQTNSIKPQLINNTNVDVLIMGKLTVIGCIDGIFCPSDKRLKENISEIDDINLLKLNPVKYNFNYDKDKMIHYGLIAQEVEEHFPELVNETYDKLKIKTMIKKYGCKLLKNFFAESRSTQYKVYHNRKDCQQLFS